VDGLLPHRLVSLTASQSLSTCTV